MKQLDLRRWHRRAGILLAPFLLLQALSGLVLSYGVYSQVATSLAGEAPQPVRSAWNLLMAKTHYGPGLAGWMYHSLVGLGLLWLIGSGLWIWVDLRRRQKQGGEGQK
ncbi:MAG TPA: hypothetical protein VJ910_03730 [Desulfuromonadales bacterium]|nr:hypothetical protein [Desulfuromonadales bacterium]